MLLGRAPVIRMPIGDPRTQLLTAALFRRRDASDSHLSMQRCLCFEQFGLWFLCGYGAFYIMWLGVSLVDQLTSSGWVLPEGDSYDCGY